MENIILLKQDNEKIDRIFWALGVYFSNKFLDRNGVYLGIDEYQYYKDFILEKVKIDTIKIDSLIFLCLQYSKAVDFAINQWDKRNSEINTKIKQAESHLKLLNLVEIFKSSLSSADSIHFSKIVFEFSKDGQKEKLEFDLPEILLNNVEFTFSENLKTKEFYEYVISFLTTNIHQYDESYYRKMAARSLKMYCRMHNILEKENVKNPAKQMRFINSLLALFRIIDLEKYTEGLEVERIISLLETPFRIKEHGIRSKIKKINEEDFPEFYK